MISKEKEILMESSVRPFKPQTLQEQRMIKWEKELTEIQKWLDK